MAEATPEEIKLILRWIMDFRSLVISLPDNKHTVWSSSRHRFSKSERIGNLNRPSRSFRHDIAIHTTFLADCKNGITVEEQVMPTECRLDLGLMMKFLDKAHDGIDMNLLSFRRLTHHMNRSDSCPFGLGGYSDEGFTWRFELQPGLHF